VAWILSVLGIISLWLMGDKKVSGILVGLSCQAFWFYYTITTKQYGFIPGVIVYTLVYLRNLYLWKGEEKHGAI